MSGAQSISTRRAYGVQRVCRVWHCARSSVYAQAAAAPCLAAGRSAPPRTPSKGLAVSWRRVPESLSEAARGDPPAKERVDG